MFEYIKNISNIEEYTKQCPHLVSGILTAERALFSEGHLCGYEQLSMHKITVETLSFVTQIALPAAVV